MTDAWDFSWGSEYSCPICGSSDIVLPSGDENSPYLIIGTAPGTEEVKEHAPMVGKTGGVLKNELRRLGRDISEFRITNLYQHPVQLDKKDPNIPKCFEYGATLAIKEAVGKKAILLIGAETTKYFTGLSVETHSGLRVSSQYLSCENIFCMVQPTMVFKNGIGEVRLGLSKFIRQLERIENEHNV
jgi:uracil-DNA glycosylase family 4